MEIINDNTIFKKEFHWKETHIKFNADLPKGLDAAKRAVIHSRALLEQYISDHPEFMSTLEPLELDLNAPEFIRNMLHAGLAADVGPMAAVAGALAEIATEAMELNGCKLAVTENGGDISVKGSTGINIGVFTGTNSIANQVGFKIRSSDLPLGICTSAGQLGHSVSFGDSEAVIVFSRSAFLSDAAATAVGNYIKKADPETTIQRALEKADDIDGISGCMVFIGELIGRMGRIPELIEIKDSTV